MMMSRFSSLAKSHEDDNIFVKQVQTLPVNTNSHEWLNLIRSIANDTGRDYNIPKNNHETCGNCINSVLEQR